MTWEVVSEDRNARDGSAIAKTVTLYFPNERDGSSRMRMNLYLTLPKTGQRVPTFLIAGVGRSGQPPAFNQPVFDRGYGMAYADILALQPDHKDAAGGYADSIRKFYAPANQEEPGESEWGALGSWAWALSRAMDYLQTDKDLDSRRIYLNGVSRYGKAAMWAGAQDTRFAATFSGESGCGGAVIVRRQYGETVRAITGSFPYWFARKFADYAERRQRASGGLARARRPPRAASRVHRHGRRRPLGRSARLVSRRQVRRPCLRAVWRNRRRRGRHAARCNTRRPVHRIPHADRLARPERLRLGTVHGLC